MRVEHIAIVHAVLTLGLYFYIFRGKVDYRGLDTIVRVADTLTCLTICAAIAAILTAILYKGVELFT